MNINTRFSVGDSIWIGYTASKEVYTPCPSCASKGTVKACFANGEKEICCPACYGRRFDTSWTPDVRQIRGPLTVGSVRYDSHEPDGRKECYMCEETGVGSGTLFYGGAVFASKEEGEAWVNADTPRTTEANPSERVCGGGA